MNIPQELRYTKDHEWTKVDGDTVTIGVSEFAIEQLGDITLVELPEEGSAVKAGEAIGVIESVKAVSDLYAPISGTIKAINDKLEDAPEMVNEDPYGEGWMLKIVAENPKELEGLFDAAAYKAHLETLED